MLPEHFFKQYANDTSVKVKTARTIWNIISCTTVPVKIKPCEDYDAIEVSIGTSMFVDVYEDHFEIYMLNKSSEMKVPISHMGIETILEKMNLLYDTKILRILNHTVRFKNRAHLDICDRLFSASYTNIFRINTHIFRDETYAFYSNLQSLFKAIGAPLEVHNGHDIMFVQDVPHRSIFETHRINSELLYKTKQFIEFLEWHYTPDKLHID